MDNEYLQDGKAAKERIIYRLASVIEEENYLEQKEVHQGIQALRYLEVTEDRLIDLNYEYSVVAGYLKTFHKYNLPKNRMILSFSVGCITFVSIAFVFLIGFIFGGMKKDNELYQKAHQKGFSQGQQFERQIRIRIRNEGVEKSW